jgi:AhpD family alkylhydroperoxidase
MRTNQVENMSRGRFLHDAGVLKNISKRVKISIFNCQKSINKKAMGALKPIFGLTTYIKKSSIEGKLKELIDFRVSQMNGCAYCLDMHWKEARAHGETEQRLYGLDAWRETPYYTDRERAALAWAEAMTNVDISDDVYTNVKTQLSDEELIDLTIVVTTINTWNRINLAFPNAVGTYKVGQWG